MTSLPHAMAAFARQTALEQRAQLLEAVWEDARGQRRAVQAGILPARLLPAPERAASPIQRYAADLRCCPDGEWRVARDDVGPHPGATLLHAPVLAAFLPCLCRLLLGETLRLPSVPVWWLGEPHYRPRLAADGRRFAIRSALDPTTPPIPLAGLPPHERHALQSAVDADPALFIAVLDIGRHAPTRHVTFDTGHGTGGLNG